MPSLRRASALQRKCACGGGSGGCSDCKEESEGKLQRRAANPPGPATAPPIVHEVLRSPGRPLDASTRGFMEQRFGADFGGVRVHTDSQGAESAQAVHSRAYTVGRDIAFGAGEYRPDTEPGRRLLAHELAHVVQQAGAAQPGVQRAGDAEQAETTSAVGEEPAQPMGPPDAAPACADVCGDPANCKRETDEKCEEAEEGIILSVWNKVAANVANADSAFDPAALTPAATMALKMPDPYASLIDDLLPATPAPSAPAPTPAPKP